MHQLDGVKPEFSGLVAGNHVDMWGLASIALIAVRVKPIAATVRHAPTQALIYALEATAPGTESIVPLRARHSALSRPPFI
jgi:hypothetical protein